MSRAEILTPVPPPDTKPPAARFFNPERGLDFLNLFVANLQTGFGPFIATYLTTQGWTQTAIGIALSIGTITSMLSQIPAGALVDATPRKRRVAAISIFSFTGSALLLGLFPVQLFVYLAEILHGISSCTYGPAVAAISLAIAGQAALGRRLGRNARFASIGSSLGAGILGLCGYYISERAVFFATALLTLPALLALIPLQPVDALYEVPPKRRGVRAEARLIGHLLAEPALVIFGLAATLFTLANSAMLPLAAGEMTHKVGNTASLLIGACMVIPQIFVAIVSPAVGRLTQLWGRKPIMLIGFCVLPLRGFLFAVVTDPYLLVAIQVLDFISASCFGILVTLVTSDVAGKSGHFNLALGLVGFAIGIGATLSTSVAGFISDRFGNPAVFSTLGATGLLAFLIVLFFMPETRPAGPVTGAETGPVKDQS